MATSLEEAVELVELARAARAICCRLRTWCSAIPFRQCGACASRRHWQGRLRPRAVWLGRPELVNGFTSPGRQLVFDLGVYNVTSLTALLGPAKRVTALAGIAIPERIVDGHQIKVDAVDNAHVLLDFGEGVYAVITTGFTLQQYRVPGIELYGTEGTLQMVGERLGPERLWLWQNQAGCWQISRRPILAGAGPMACATWSNVSATVSARS